MTTAVPILNLPDLYATGGEITWLTSATLAVAAGQFRDSTNTYDIVTPAATIDAANNGLNGLDSGSLAASSQYAVLAISDPVSGNTAGYMLTTVPVIAPLMPFGYSAYRVIGYWLTDGSSNLRKGYVSGKGKRRKHLHDTSISVLSGGTATTLTSVSLSGAVINLDNIPVTLDVSYTPATAGDSVSVAPFGSTATVLPVLSASVAAVAAKGQLQTFSKPNNSAVPTILYINSAAAGSASIWVSGFDYSI